MAIAFYNEIDPYAAQWLRNLIEAGHIAPGIVDERDIRDIQPVELSRYTQCHFFAGIGVWSYALRQAGWPDDRPVWTGSCPCQPFSAAGRRGGTTDERHLWPHWFHLIEICRPPIVFGEQVASKDGLGWLDLVQADLEGADYAGGAFDLCAAGVGAPHVRQRLWFVAERLEHAKSDGRNERRPESGGRGVIGGCGTSRMADTSRTGLEGRDQGTMGNKCATAERSGGAGGLADAHEQQRDWGGNGRETGRGEFANNSAIVQQPGATGPTNGYWRNADWLGCRDGKWRPVEPGTFPLVNGAPARVGRLRAYGNAIVAAVAEAFVKSYIEARIFL